MKNHLLDRWNSDELVGINSLIRDDGSAIILNCNSFVIGGENLHVCVPICETTIASIEKFDDDIWSEFQGFTEYTDKQTGKIYVGGEGAMGNEGFIACLTAEKNPIWALFFVNSNPFYELEIKDGNLEAISSLNLKYSVNLESPEKMTISNFEWKG